MTKQIKKFIKSLPKSRECLDIQSIFEGNGKQDGIEYNYICIPIIYNKYGIIDFDVLDSVFRDIEGFVFKQYGYLGANNSCYINKRRRKQVLEIALE